MKRKKSLRRPRNITRGMLRRIKRGTFNPYRGGRCLGRRPGRTRRKKVW